MLDIRSCNHAALQYSKVMTEPLKEFWKPLFPQLGDTNFTYCKIMNNGTRLYLSIIPNWSEWYVDNSFQDDIEHLKHYVPKEKESISLWSAHKRDAIVDSYDMHNLGHGFSIHQHHGEYCEYFDFSSHKEDYMYPTKCLNTLGLIQEYIKKFQRECRLIVDTTDQQKLFVSKKWIPFEQIWRQENHINSNILSNFLKALKK